MSVIQTMQCPRCGTVRAAHAAPLDLCPACLLAAALSTDDELCPYEVLAPIGGRAGGVTYLAQALTGRGGYVALKIFGPRDDAHAVIARYRHWQARLTAITHPGVSRLLDVGLTADGLLYLASEYVAGWPLTALASHPSMGKDERREMARQLTEAMAAVHAAGVAHLKLDESSVKISTANGIHTTILGLGARIVVDDAVASPEIDRLALAAIVRELGVET